MRKGSSSGSKNWQDENTNVPDEERQIISLVWMFPQAHEDFRPYHRSHHEPCIIHGVILHGTDTTEFGYEDMQDFRRQGRFMRREDYTPGLWKFLKKYMPNIGPHRHDPDDEWNTAYHWRRQWAKHGQTMTELNFYLLIMELSTAAPLLRWLEEARLYRSDRALPSTAEAIQACLFPKLNDYFPTIQAHNLPGQINQNRLYQVHIYFDHDLNFIGTPFYTFRGCNKNDILVIVGRRE